MVYKRVCIMMELKHCKPRRSLEPKEIFSGWLMETKGEGEHGGASAIMRKDGQNCCSRNSFLWEDNLQLGNRPFYVPPSPVIGCHWSCVRGKRLHGSFPDFPGEFFSHCILRLWRSKQYATVDSLKKLHSPYEGSINTDLRHCAALSPRDDKRSVATFLRYLTSLRTQQRWLLTALQKCSS